MAKSRAELDDDLKQLDASLPEVLAGTDAAYAMDAFAGLAEVIEDATGPEDAEYVWGRLSVIIKKYGLEERA